MSYRSGETESQQRETPFADALTRLTSTGLSSVHALPLSQGHMIENSALKSRYLSLFGREFLSSDVSFSSPVIDSFFRPRSCLAAAQNLAAEAFGADRTFFVTSGTTTSNMVAMAAMDLAGKRILIDRTAHQSVHFAADRSGAQVAYAGTYARSGDGFIKSNIDAFVEEFVAAARRGSPYHAVVLAGASYGGELLRLPSLFETFFEYVDELDVLVDEAWAALHSFHPDLSEETALAAGRHVRSVLPGKTLRLHVTHSAHKSMASLRQGSYLHVLGDDRAVDRTERALYAMHTTSPSLPILASLDLARAQAVAEGEGMVDRSMQHAERLRRLLEGATLPGLRHSPPEAESAWLKPDPTKVICDAAGLGLTAKDLRMRLFNDHGIYASLGSGSRLLLNIHAGVTPTVMRRIERALSTLCAAVSGRVDLGSGFLVPYPPGIPLTVPGEARPDDLDEVLTEFRRSGVDVFAVPAFASRN